MNAMDVFTEIIDRLACMAPDISIYLNKDDMNDWPREGLEALKSQSIIVRARPAKTVICPGCENQCAKTVQSYGESYFVQCDVRDDVCIYPILGESLRQWKTSLHNIITFISDELGLREKRHQNSTLKLDIGIYHSKKKSQMLSLSIKEVLHLVAGNQSLTLSEIIGFHEGKYFVYADRVERLVANSTTGDPRYTPTNVKREARKVKTKNKHEQIIKEYKQLMRKSPGYSDTWYAKQLAKTQKGKKLNSETIRKIIGKAN